MIDRIRDPSADLKRHADRSANPLNWQVRVASTLPPRRRRIAGIPMGLPSLTSLTLYLELRFRKLRYPAHVLRNHGGHAAPCAEWR
jgi:hypothetical protein